MTASASQRPTAFRDGSLVEEHFPIRCTPGELPSSVDKFRVSAIRRVTRSRLVSCGLTCVADDAELVVSELITNAILHSGGEQVSLTLELRDGVLRIQVHDGVADFGPAAVQGPSDDENGRGLALVHGIARSRHGTSGVSDGGATAWCELALAVC